MSPEKSLKRIKRTAHFKEDLEAEKYLYLIHHVHLFSKIKHKVLFFRNN